MGDARCDAQQRSLRPQRVQRLRQSDHGRLRCDRGAGAEPAYLFESHKYGYDFETLSRVLTDAGFGAVVRSNYMESAHEALRVDDISAVANAKYGDRYYSLFVEARRES